MNCNPGQGPDFPAQIQCFQGQKIDWAQAIPPPVSSSPDQRNLKKDSRVPEESDDPRLQVVRIFNDPEF
ncbi:MAG: hypothetical protein RL289_374 [Actinomycetota bacterium]|jgi:hypothetical protein